VLPGRWNRAEGEERYDDTAESKLAGIVSGEFIIERSSTGARKMRGSLLIEAN